MSTMFYRTTWNNGSVYTIFICEFKNRNIYSFFNCFYYFLFKFLFSALFICIILTGYGLARLNGLFMHLFTDSTYLKMVIWNWVRFEKSILMECDTRWLSCYVKRIKNVQSKNDFSSKSLDDINHQRIIGCQMTESYVQETEIVSRRKFYNVNR